MSDEDLNGGLIGVHKAVEIAAAFALEAYESKIGSIRLEEVELSEAGGHWRVTLSWVHDEDLPTGVFEAAAMGSRRGRRTFKVFEIDRAGGEVRSMKIRELADGD